MTFVKSEARKSGSALTSWRYPIGARLVSMTLSGVLGAETPPKSFGMVPRKGSCESSLQWSPWNGPRVQGEAKSPCEGSNADMFEWCHMTLNAVSGSKYWHHISRGIQQGGCAWAPIWQEVWYYHTHLAPNCNYWTAGSTGGNLFWLLGFTNSGLMIAVQLFEPER